MVYVLLKDFFINHPGRVLLVEEAATWADVSRNTASKHLLELHARGVLAKAELRYLREGKIVRCVGYYLAGTFPYVPHAPPTMEIKNLEPLKGRG